MSLMSLRTRATVRVVEWLTSDRPRDGYPGWLQNLPQEGGVPGAPAPAPPRVVVADIRPRYTHSDNGVSMPATSTAAVLAFFDAAGEVAPYGHWPDNATSPLPYVRTPDAAEWLEDTEGVYPGYHLGRGEDDGTTEPTITLLDPDAGDEDGDLRIEATGRNLAGVTKVTIGGQPATELTVIDAKTLTFLTPALPVGVYDVEFTFPDASVMLDDAFTVFAFPDVDVIDPNLGPVAGGTVVVITGANFSGVDAVLFGDAEAAFSVDSDTQVTATTPPGAAGAVYVAVISPGGNLTVPNGFTYVAAPTITGINPTSGPPAGGTVVTILGTNLGEA